MSVPSYDVTFGKLQLHNLFEDYFDQVGNTTSRIMLKALEKNNFDVTVKVSYQTCLWHSDDPHTFVDLHVSTSNTVWQLTSSVCSPQFGIGAFGTLPLIMGNRVHSDDYGIMGIRYGSENLSIGASIVPFPFSGELEVPSGAWLVGRKGNLSAGVQYKPLSANKHQMVFTAPESWNCAISYSAGSTTPLKPSSIFMLEFARSTQLTASFYQHLVLQRGVKTPLEDKVVSEITNYVNFGIEFATRTDKDKSIENGNSWFQLAASWQDNKNILLKGKLCPSKSSIALALKSWWRPSVTFTITALFDHSKRTSSYGFGIRTEDHRQPSYQIYDSNYVMVAPSEQQTGKQRPKFLRAPHTDYYRLPGLLTGYCKLRLPLFFFFFEHLHVGKFFYR